MFCMFKGPNRVTRSIPNHIMKFQNPTKTEVTTRFHRRKEWRNDESGKIQCIKFNRFKSNTVNEKTREKPLQNCKNQFQPRILHFIKCKEFHRGQVFKKFLPMCLFPGKCAPVKQENITRQRETESRTQGIQHERAVM